MPKCPFCDNELKAPGSEGWQCECGEMVPFGFEIDSAENCETCPVMYCPNRKKPARGDLKNMQL